MRSRDVDWVGCDSTVDWAQGAPLHWYRWRGGDGADHQLLGVAGRELQRSRSEGINSDSCRSYKSWSKVTSSATVHPSWVICGRCWSTPKTPRMALYVLFVGWDVQPKSLLNTKRDEYLQKKAELEEWKAKLAMMDKSISECNKRRDSRKDKKEQKKDSERKERHKKSHSWCDYYYIIIFFWNGTSPAVSTCLTLVTFAPGITRPLPGLFWVAKFAPWEVDALQSLQWGLCTHDAPTWWIRTRVGGSVVHHRGVGPPIRSSCRPPQEYLLSSQDQKETKWCSLLQQEHLQVHRESSSTCAAARAIRCAHQVDLLGARCI